MSTQMIVANVVIYNSSDRSLSITNVAKAAACQVQMELDENGNIVSKGCKSVSCSGTCTLLEKDKGNGVIEYTCKCDA